MNLVPAIGVFDGTADGNEEPDGVRRVGEHDDYAEDKEADEAGFGGIAGGEQALEFSAVVVETVDEEDWRSVSVLISWVVSKGKLTGIISSNAHGNGSPHETENDAGPACIVG